MIRSAYWTLRASLALILTVPSLDSAWALDSARALDSATHRPPDMLPDGLLVRGTNDIQAAWLTDPTARYPHGAIGDLVEAGGISIQRPNGQVVSLTLPVDAVFEDRYPRLVDLDGDGRDEMVVVKTSQTRGAALVLIGLRDGALKILAETDPIGQPQRWLSPAGVGDFDGDGQINLAYVETPHIGGTLRIVKWQGTRLVQLYEQSGFSNHAIGTPDLELSAVFDINGDGVVDLVVPDNPRRRLKAVSFKGGRFQELSSMSLTAPLLRLQMLESGSLQAILVDNTTVDVRFQTPNTTPSPPRTAP